MLTRRLSARRAAASTPAIAAAVALALTHIGVDTVTGSVSALLPILDERFSLSGTQVGAMVATVSVSSLLAQPFVGGLADRVGARRVAVAGAILSSTLLSLLGVTHHLGLIFAILIVGGLGSAGFHPAAAVLAHRALPDRAGLAVGLFTAGGMLGLALGPLIVLLVAARAGLGFTPLLMIPGLATGALLWRLLPDDPPSAARPRISDALGLLRGPIGQLAAAGTMAAVAVTTFTAGMPLWLAQQAGGELDATLIGGSLAIFEIAGAVGGIAASWAATRAAPSRVAASSLLLAFVPLATLLSLPAGSIGYFMAIALAGGLSNAAMPIFIVAAQERADGAVAAASGLLIGFATGLAGLLFIGVGVLADLAGIERALLLGFTGVVPASVLARRRLITGAPTASVLEMPSTRCGCVGFVDRLCVIPA